MSENKKIKDKFEEVVQTIASKLVAEYKPEKIILYGSSTNGNLHEDSDIDMLIIKDVSIKNYSTRWMEVRKLTRSLTMGIPFEPIILTKGEVDKSIKDGNYFIIDILNSGKILYEKN